MTYGHALKFLLIMAAATLVASCSTSMDAVMSTPVCDAPTFPDLSSDHISYIEVRQVFTAQTQSVVIDDPATMRLIASQIQSIGGEWRGTWHTPAMGDVALYFRSGPETSIEMFSLSDGWIATHFGCGELTGFASREIPEEISDAIFALTGVWPPK